LIVFRIAEARSTPACAACTVSCAAAKVRYASAVTATTSNSVRFSAASDWAREASATAVFERLKPKSNGSQLTSAPSALPHADPELFVPSTGPEIEGMTLCGNSSPKTLFLVARFSCANASTRGR
jgi:hypothetical protein